MITIISLLVANLSLNLTCLALAELRSQSSVLGGRCLKFWRCVYEPGVKVNSVYYCDNILEQGLLPDIRYLSNDDFPFQQDGAPPNRSCRTIAYLRSHMPKFIELEN